MAEKYNIAIDAGATFFTQFSWLDAYSNPIDLTDYTISSQIRVKENSPSASTTFTVAIVPPAMSGTFTLTLDPSQSLALTGSCYVYDIRAVSGAFAQRIVEGKATIDPATTR